MALYNIDLDLSESEDVNVAKISFGDPAGNDLIVKFIDKVAITEEMLDHLNGKPLFINGPASLPVAFVLCHKWAHLFPSIWVYDPKLGAYVCCVTHTDNADVGDLAHLS